MSRPLCFTAAGAVEDFTSFPVRTLLGVTDAAPLADDPCKASDIRK